MSNIFTSISSRKPKRHKFNLSHENKLTAPIGKLVPVLCEEILPGDKVKLDIEHLIKFQPMLHPIMQRLDVSFHAFFVPNRLVWDKWEEFITGGELGTATPHPPVITVNNTVGQKTFDVGSLSDYLGYPTNWKGPNEVQLNLIPFKVYNKIYNDYYRDQNLEDEIDLKTSQNGWVPVGSHDLTFYDLKDRAYRKDYFTSALPFPQRGPSVPIPLDIEAEFKYKADGQTVIRNQNGTQYGQDGAIKTVGGRVTVEDSQNVNIDNTQNLELDIKQTGASITDLRRSFKVQEWLEKMARGGARYAEQLVNMWGVRSSDARLQRAEYLGGSMSPVIISEVLQQSSTQENNTPLGDFAGNGTSVSRGGLVRKFFEEHGWLMVIMSVIPRASYWQGTPRKFFRYTKEEYYWPQFAHIGEEPIQNGEIYTGTDITGEEADATFGYKPRYAEYRYSPDEVHGDFRDTLKWWHMGREFDGIPPLNSEFIKVSNDEVNRVFAVNQDKAQPLLCQLYFNSKFSRLVSRYGTPRI